MRFCALAVLISFLAGCGGGGESGASSGSREVASDTKTIAEGAGVSYTLSPGTYQAIISSSSNGVKVAWVGGIGCNNSGEVKTYNDVCKMGQTGQVTITNPTTFGLGASENVTIRIRLNP